jgi:ATP-dependent RNA helicase RhlE
MPSVLVFTRTRRSARRLARSVAADGFAVAELHSDLTQPQRNRAMEGFRRGDFQVMVATNIAARGLDVEHITHVISFDVPDVPDDYVHRIGRTARAEAEGDAYVLVSPGEEKSLAAIERHIGQRLPRVSLPDFDYSARAPEGTGKSRARPGGKRAGKSSRPASRSRSSKPRASGPGQTGAKGPPRNEPRPRRR